VATTVAETVKTTEHINRHFEKGTSAIVDPSFTHAQLDYKLMVVTKRAPGSERVII
jgi:hypothetical protein